MKQLRPFLIILLVLLLAYSPIASFHFALKNDMFLGYFPPKYLLGEVLKSGYLPLWNPYICFGIPFYGDMNGDFWSPLTWLIASTTGYNAYTLTLQVLFYIFIAGYGMYKLSFRYSQNRHIRLMSAISYMCNGYIIGHLQHLNWLAGAAFLPWCIWSYLKMNENASFRNAMISAVFFYLYITSSHPGLIIGAMYFFFALFCYTSIAFYSVNRISEIKRTFYINLLFICLLFLLLLGMIVGYSEIISHFSRGDKLTLTESLQQPTTIQSWISVLFPFSSVKNEQFFNTDISMRNCYFSIAFLVFSIISAFTQKNSTQKFYWLIGLFFLTLSLGGYLKIVAYQILPLIGYVRLNGEFRIFAILSLIIISTIQFDRYLIKKQNFKQHLKPVITFIGLVCLIVLIFSSYQILVHEKSILFTFKFNYFSNPFNTILKILVDNISFYDTLFIQSITQLIVIYYISATLRNSSYRKLLIIFSYDVIIATLLNLPFTGVGKASVAEIYSIHQRAPTGIPNPPMHPLTENDILPNADSALVGEWSFYNKQIGTTQKTLYPVILKTTIEYYDKMRNDSSLNMKLNPYIFLASEINGNRIIPDSVQKLNEKNIIEYSPNYIKVSFESTHPAYLVLLQNKFPHWYYSSEKKFFKVQKAGINFIGVPVKEGLNNIVFKFNPQLIRWLIFFTFSLFIIYILVIFSPFFMHLFNLTKTQS